MTQTTRTRVEEARLPEAMPCPRIACLGETFFLARHVEFGCSGFRGPAPLWEKQSLQVGGISENARAFHCFGSRGAGLHLAGIFQRKRRFGIEIDFGSAFFLSLGHDYAA